MYIEAKHAKARYGGARLNMQKLNMLNPYMQKLNPLNTNMLPPF